MKNERWVSVLGFEDRYEVSNLGRVRNKKNKKHLNFSNRISSGYYLCSLGKGKARRVHRIVLESFDRYRPYPWQVNHVDGNKLNNKLDNLEWSTPKQNMRHAYKVGLMDSKNKIHSIRMSGKSNRPLNEDKVYVIKNILASNTHSLRELAIFFEVSVRTISAIKSGEYWKHVII